MKYGMWNLGQIEALLNKVGEDNARKLLDCREVTVTFDTSDKLATITADAPALKVWKTLKRRPELKNAAGIRKALKEGGFKIGDWANDLLGQTAFTVTTEEGEVDFVCLSNADLGRPDGCQFQETCQLGVALGLELCEPDDAANVRMNYRDQPLGEWLTMAMKAIRVSHGSLDVFSVGHDGDGLWLITCRGIHDGFFSGVGRFVFRLPRKQPLVA